MAILRNAPPLLLASFTVGAPLSHSPRAPGGAGDDAALLSLGGHERGPLTRTGDSDPTSVRSDADLRIAPPP